MTPPKGIPQRPLFHCDLETASCQFVAGGENSSLTEGRGDADSFRMVDGGVFEPVSIPLQTRYWNHQPAVKISYQERSKQVILLTEAYQEKINFLYDYYQISGVNNSDQKARYAVKALEYLKNWRADELDRIRKYGYFESVDEKEFAVILTENPPFKKSQDKTIFWDIRTLDGKPANFSLNYSKQTTSYSTFDHERKPFGELVRLDYATPDQLKPVAIMKPTPYEKTWFGTYTIPTDDKYVAIPRVDGDLSYDIDAGQFYFKPDLFVGEVSFYLYPRSEIKFLLSPLPKRPAYQPRTDEPNGKIEDFSKTGQRIIREAREFLAQGKSEKEVVFWIVNQSRKAWAGYQKEPAGLDFIKKAKENSFYLFFDEIKKANCDLATIAAYELVRTAIPKANVRFATGYSDYVVYPTQGEREYGHLAFKGSYLHAWIEYVDPESNDVYLLEATPGMGGDRSEDISLFPTISMHGSPSEVSERRKAQPFFTEIDFNDSMYQKSFYYQINDFSSSIEKRVVHPDPSIEVDLTQVFDPNPKGTSSGQITYQGKPILLPITILAGNPLARRQVAPLVFSPEDSDGEYKIYYLPSLGQFVIDFETALIGETIKGSFLTVDPHYQSTLPKIKPSFGKIKFPDEVVKIMEKASEYLNFQPKELAFTFEDVQNYFQAEIPPDLKDKINQELIKKLFPSFDLQSVYGYELKGLFTYYFLKEFGYLPDQARLLIGTSSMKRELYVKVLDADGKINGFNENFFNNIGRVATRSSVYFYQDKKALLDELASGAETPLAQSVKLQFQIKRSHDPENLLLLGDQLAQSDGLVNRPPFEPDYSKSLPLKANPNDDYSLTVPITIVSPPTKKAQNAGLTEIILDGKYYKVLDAVIKSQLTKKKEINKLLIDEDYFVLFVNQLIGHDISKWLSFEEIINLKFEKLIVTDENTHKTQIYYYNAQYGFALKANFGELFIRRKDDSIFIVQWKSNQISMFNKAMLDRVGLPAPKNDYPQTNKLVLKRFELDPSIINKTNVENIYIIRSHHVFQEGGLEIVDDPQTIDPNNRIGLNNKSTKEYNLHEDWLESVFHHFIEGQTSPKKATDQDEVKLIEKAYPILLNRMDITRPVIKLQKGLDQKIVVDHEHMIYRLGMILFFINEATRLKLDGQQVGIKSRKQVIHLINKDCYEGIPDPHCDVIQEIPQEDILASSNQTLLQEVYQAFKWLEKNSEEFREELRKISILHQRNQLPNNYRAKVLYWYLRTKQQN